MSMYEARYLQLMLTSSFKLFIINSELPCLSLICQIEILGHVAFILNLSMKSVKAMFPVHRAQSNSKYHNNISANPTNK